MLRIDRPVQVDGAVAFADDEQPGVFYVVATEPRLMLRPDGTAALGLLKYRYPTGPSGAIVDLRVDLSPSPAALQQLRDKTGGATLLPPRWTDGTATMQMPTIGGAVQTQAVPMSLSGFGEAQFSFAVNADTATVLEAAFTSGSVPLSVDLMPYALGRLSSGRMRIVLHADAASDAWPTVSGLAGDARHDALKTTGAAEVQILEPPTGGTEVADQLTAWAWGFVDALLPRSTGSTMPFADTDIIIEGRTVLPCPLTTTGTVLGFDPARDRDFVTTVDLSDPIMPILDIEARTNAMFEENGIAAVIVDISYAGQTETLMFTTADDAQHVRFRWNPTARGTYSYRTSVVFVAAAQRLVLPAKQSDAHQLTVNLDDIGRLIVDVSAVAVDWTELAEIVVTVESGGGQIPLTSEPVRLTPEVRGARYERHSPSAFDDGWRYAVDYVFGDGRRIHHDMVPGFGHQVAVDDPYPRRLQVNVAAFGGFDGITSHTVEVRYGGRLRTVVLDSAHPETVISFGTDSADDKYQWHTTTTFVDGHHVTAPEQTSDMRMLAIGPPRIESFDIQVAADLLDPAVVKLVRVDVAHRRADGSEVTGSKAVTPGAPDAVISLPLREGEDPSYTLRTTVFRVDGTHVEAGPVALSDSAIVLPPHGI